MSAGSVADRRGKPVRVGSNARIPLMPDWLVHDLPADEVAALRRAEGRVMTVLEIDAHGYVWFGAENAGRWFCLRPDEIEVVGT
jgi:hypothetical protein